MNEKGMTLQQVLALMAVIENQIPQLVAVYNVLKGIAGSGKTVEELTAGADTAWDAIAAKAQAELDKLPKS